MILIRLALLPVRLALGTTWLSFRAGWAAGRLVGFSRLAGFGLGVTVGLLVAPVTGAELRERLREAIEARRSASQPLDERVRFELSHHPRTWHLPQPSVTVVEGRVTLTGEVPDENARRELVQAASALSGVTGVDDRLSVAGPGPGSV